MSGGAKLRVRVAEIVPVNELITRFRFEALDGSTCRPFPVARIRLSRWTTMARAAESLFAYVRSGRPVGL
jgi:hypothetical protein